MQSVLAKFDTLEGHNPGQRIFGLAFFFKWTGGTTVVFGHIIYPSRLNPKEHMSSIKKKDSHFYYQLSAREFWEQISIRGQHNGKSEFSTSPVVEWCEKLWRERQISYFALEISNPNSEPINSLREELDTFREELLLIAILDGAPEYSYHLHQKNQNGVKSECNEFCSPEAKEMIFGKACETVTNLYGLNQISLPGSGIFSDACIATLSDHEKDAACNAVVAAKRIQLILEEQNRIHSNDWKDELYGRFFLCTSDDFFKLRHKISLLNRDKLMIEVSVFEKLTTCSQELLMASGAILISEE